MAPVTSSRPDDGQDDGALDHPLEPGGRLRILVAVVDQIFQFALEIGGEAAAELVEVDVAGAHDRSGVLIIDQRQQEVLERRIDVVALVGQGQSAVQRLLEVARNVGMSGLSITRHIAPAFPHFHLDHFFHDALQRMLVFAGSP